MNMKTCKLRHAIWLKIVKVLIKCWKLVPASLNLANCEPTVSRRYDKLTNWKLSFKPLLLIFSWEKQIILLFASAFGVLTEA